MLSNEDRTSGPSNATKENEASTIVSDSDSDLFNRNMPVFIVQVRGGLLDSEVPALRMDVENREMSVDWKNMYTSYFSQRLTGIAQKDTVSLCKITVGAAVFLGLETDDLQDAASPETGEEVDARTQHRQHLQYLTIVRDNPNVDLRPAQLQRWCRTLQVRAYRETCGSRIGHGNVVSVEKLRKRRIADCEVYVDDVDFAMPGNTYVRRPVAIAICRRC